MPECKSVSVLGSRLWDTVITRAMLIHIRDVILTPTGTPTDITPTVTPRYSTAAQSCSGGREWFTTNTTDRTLDTDRFRRSPLSSWERLGDRQLRGSPQAAEFLWGASS